MGLWRIIMLTAMMITGLSVFYLSYRLGRFSFFKGRKLKFFGGAFFVVMGFSLMGVFLNFINAIICVIYLTLISLVCDFLFWIYQKISRKTLNYNRSFLLALVLTVFSLSLGWYNVHYVWQTDYKIQTNKNIQNIKIAMFADAHIGTAFNAKGFEKHLQKIQSQNPDIVVVVGDFVDDDTTRADMIKSVEALGKIQPPKGIYFVFGNHDKGYYGARHRGFSGQDLINELQQNGIRVLRDEVVLIDDNFYLIGRKDKSQGRQNMDALTANLDKSKYILVLDHQPNDYENQIRGGADLVLSGHTHGGQLFPFNYVGEYLKINDKTYGYERRGQTDFIVTSGISDWAIRFKTGTQSEYVIIELSEKE